MITFVKKYRLHFELLALFGAVHLFSAYTLVRPAEFLIWVAITKLLYIEQKMSKTT